MPNTVVSYSCLICQKEYRDFDDAIACEDSHYQLDDFTISKVGNEKSPNIDFPRSVQIANRKNNEELALYIFKRTIKPKKNGLKA